MAKEAKRINKIISIKRSLISKAKRKAKKNGHNTLKPYLEKVIETEINK